MWARLHQRRLKSREEPLASIGIQETFRQSWRRTVNDSVEVSTDDDSGYDYGDIVIYDAEDKNAKREKRDLCRYSQ